MIPSIRYTFQFNRPGRAGDYRSARSFIEGLFATSAASRENGPESTRGVRPEDQEEEGMAAEVKSVSPLQAWELAKNNQRAVLIDVRSSMEYLFVGHPQGSIHVPWIDAPDWTVNANFITEVRKVMLGGIGAGVHAGDAPVILICRSGKRSLEAGKLLINNEFTEVYNVDEGFEGELDGSHHRSTVGGWRFHGLPWEQC